MNTVPINFYQNGNEFILIPAIQQDAGLEKLPPGNYHVKISMAHGYYLEKTDSFSAPSKLYGDIGAKADRVLSTFMKKDKNLGILLTGLKGSGKTLLAKLISIKGATLGIPTLVINTGTKDERFFQFLASIKQQLIILFDEFEKTFDKKQQESLLTVLDGTYPSKKLFILTSNGRSGIDEHLQNRPGRIHYNFDFAGLSTEFITQYIEENLDNKNYKEELLIWCELNSPVNFDSLSTLIWEINTYNESPSVASKSLNTRPESGRSFYKYEIWIKALNKTFSGDWVSPNRGLISLTDFFLSLEVKIPLAPKERMKLLGWNIEKYLQYVEEGEDLLKMEQDSLPTKKNPFIESDLVREILLVNGRKTPISLGSILLPTIFSPDNVFNQYRHTGLVRVDTVNKKYYYEDPVGNILTLTRDNYSSLNFSSSGLGSSFFSGGYDSGVSADDEPYSDLSIKGEE